MAVYVTPSSCWGHNKGQLSFLNLFPSIGGIFEEQILGWIGDAKLLLDSPAEFGVDRRALVI